VSDTVEVKRTSAGRPPAELSDERRVQLIELAERLASVESEARQLRAQIVEAASAAVAEGASHRAIGEALGVAKQSVRALLDGGTS
jgi:transposase